MNAIFNFVSEHSISLGSEKVKFILNSLDKRIIFVATCAFVCLTAIYNRPRIATLLSSLYDLWYGKSLDLSKFKLKSIPPELGNFSNLTHLNLNNNQLTSIPPELGNLSKLRFLCLGGNQLKSIPPQLGDLSDLQCLWLQSNQLTTLPSEIGNLSNLTHLNLNNNQLTSIPPELGNLSKLRFLCLGGNQLKSIPPQLGDLSDLQCLWLQSNQLTTLPSEIGNLHALENLEVRNNPKLTQLPQSLGQCPNLTYINCEGTGIPDHEVQAILAASKALRDKQAGDVLPKRLAAWKVFSKGNFELDFITDLTEHERQAINEWLLRLEGTKDFSAATKKSLACAVCGILESLNESSSFKTLFFDQISSNLTACGDRSAMAFNELFLSWKLETLDPSASEHDKFELMIQASKTAALREAIQKCIAEQEAKEGQEIHESVEIYLYYETELKKELGLLSFMDKMIFTEIGRRDWIDKKALAKEVNCTFLEEMAEFSSLVAIRDLDPNYIQQWSSFENEFNDQLDEVEQKLKDQSITDGIYNEKMKKIQKKREETQRKETIKWLKLKLKSHGLLF